MSSVLAKKYANALVQSCDKDELSEVYGLLEKLLQAFKIDKFNTIVLFLDVSTSDKEDLILSLVESKNRKFKNFIKILGKNDRLKYIPEIVKELKYQIALQNNQFEGEITSSVALSKKEISDLEESFSKRFHATIKLSNKVDYYPGLKIQVDDLGVEVDFSSERLRTQLVNHILKAI